MTLSKQLINQDAPRLYCIAGGMMRQGGYFIPRKILWRNRPQPTLSREALKFLLLVLLPFPALYVAGLKFAFEW
jgi:hypothetical protein